MPDRSDPAVSHAPAAGADEARLPGLGAVAVAAAAGGLAVAIAWHYPLDPALLIAVLCAYAGALWRWPLLWLAVVPAALPAFDLAPWTGWTFVEEPDLLVLVTIAVLALRARPRRADFIIGGLAGAAIALALVTTLVGIVTGLTRPGPPGGTAIAELSPLDALRVGKGFVAALALMPFLRRAVRMRPDALQWLTIGMAAGLAFVAAATMAERAVFTGPFDFHTVYRIVATFSSMHFGGGYVGAYVAMALPFLFVLPRGRRGVGAIATAGIAAGALYTLVVTFARAAYASAVIGSIVVVLVRVWGARRSGGGKRALVLPLVLLAVVGGIAATAAEDARFMVRRLDRTLPDLAARLEEWREGLVLGDGGVRAALVGMGLGSYARTVLARRPSGRFPTNVVLGAENGRRFLTVQSGLPLYIGQKVAIAPYQAYRVHVVLRARGGEGSLVVFLCEKLLLYSLNCHGTELQPDAANTWEEFTDTIASGDLEVRRELGLHRPIELSLLVPEPGATLDIADVSFTDRDGRELLANGDFAQGMTRWFLTDDDHAIWRIENQYLTTFFEEGALGLAALVLLAAVALRAALRAAKRGNATAPALAAALAAFLGERTLRLSPRSPPPRRPLLPHRLRRIGGRCGDNRRARPLPASS